MLVPGHTTFSRGRAAVSRGLRRFPTIFPGQELLPLSPVAIGTRLWVMTWWTMPLGRYFGFAGSLLLALLFLTDWYIPKPSAASDRAEVDRSIIRIHTMHRWPEAIVFDTSLPTITPPPAVMADVPVLRTPRDALALLPQTSPAAAAYRPATEAKPAVAMKRRTKTVRVATRGIASHRAAGPGNLFIAGW